MPCVSYPLIPFVYLRDIQVPQAVKDISASYDALVDLFSSFENFPGRLSIYTEIPLTTAMANVLVKIIVELIPTLALAAQTLEVVHGLVWRTRAIMSGEIILSALFFLRFLLNFTPPGADRNESAASISRALGMLSVFRR